MLPKGLCSCSSSFNDRQRRRRTAPAWPLRSACPTLRVMNAEDAATNLYEVRVGRTLVSAAALVWAVASGSSHDPFWADPAVRSPPARWPVSRVRWAFFAATMAGYALVRNRWSQVNVSLVARAALFSGVVIEAIRTVWQTSSSGRPAYVGVLAALAAFSGAMLVGAATNSRRSAPIGAEDRST